MNIVGDGKATWHGLKVVEAGSSLQLGQVSAGWFLLGQTFLLFLNL